MLLSLIVLLLHKLFPVTTVPQNEIKHIVLPQWKKHFHAQLILD